MKTLVFALVASTVLSTVSFAGTARKISMKEQSVVARTLAPVVPSMVQGNDVQLYTCILGNSASQGQAEALYVSCEYQTSAGFKGYVNFDAVQIDDNQEIQSVEFKSITRIEKSASSRP